MPIQPTGFSTTAISPRKAMQSNGNPLASKASVRFSSSFEPQHPKLTYKPLKTIQDPIIGKIEVYQFSNGMKFYGVQRNRVPLVNFGELIHTGSVNEREAENGVSHFLEHLIFKGSKYLKPGEFDHKIEELGGKINAFTWHDETFYYTYNLPKEGLREAIKLRAEFIQHANIPPEELEKERTTVISEIDMYKGDPSAELEAKREQMIWQDSPLRRPVLGPKKVIATIPRDSLMSYYYRFYAPQKRDIIMIGDFNLNEALDAIAEEYNIPFPEQKPHQNRQNLKPLFSPNNRETILTRNISTATVALGFDGPKGVHDDIRGRAALNMAATILGDGESARLYQALVEEQLAHDVDASFLPTKTRSAFTVDVNTEPDKIDAVKTILKQELQRIATEGVSEGELNKARKNLRRSIATSTEKNSSLMERLALLVSKTDLTHTFDDQLKIAGTITSKDVQAAAQKYLNSQKAYTVILRPPTKPKKKPRFGGSLGNAASLKLPNGAEILVQQEPNTLQSALTLLVRKPQGAPPLPGVYDLLAKMIERGTQNLPAKALQKKLDENGISLDVNVNQDNLALEFRGDSQDTAIMYDIAKELLTQEPAFLESDLKLVQNQFRNELSDLLDTRPLYYSFDLAKKHLFPGTHPYGTTLGEKIENLEKITPDILRSQYRSLFQPKNISIAMVGPDNLNQFGSQAEKWLTPLQNTEGSSQNLEAPKAPELQSDIMVTKAIKTVKEMPLSEIVRSWKVPGLKSQEKATLMVLNNILSGGMSNRLFQTFREGEHGGLCYSVSSFDKLWLKDGMFNMYIGTAHQNVPLVLKLIQKEVDKLTHEPPTEAELHKAKQNLKSNFWSKQETMSDIADSLAEHRLYGTDSPQELLAKMNQVTVKDIQAFAQKYLTKPSVTAITAPKEALIQNKLLSEK